MIRMTAGKSFQARLERYDSPLKWVIIHIPFDAGKVWGVRGRLPVKGDINGFAFRTSLFPTRDGGHMMLVNKRMQAAAKAGVGTVAKFRLEPDTEERTAIMPVELKEALKEDRALGRWFAKLNYSLHKEIADWITQVKSVEARTRRSNQIVERLLATMQAERELPPVLRVAFANNPPAQEGWNRMSPVRRRRHLLGIFYYWSPEARSRRIAKAVEDALRFAP